MILFFGMQLFPIGYGLLYLFHSIRKKRGGQAIAIGALLMLELSACIVLLWEFLATP